MLSDNLIRKLQQANVIGVLGFEDKETRYMKSEVGNRKNKEKKYRNEIRITMAKTQESSTESQDLDNVCGTSG